MWRIAGFEFILVHRVDQIWTDSELDEPSAPTMNQPTQQRYEETNQQQYVAASSLHVVEVTDGTLVANTQLHIEPGPSPLAAETSSPTSRTLMWLTGFSAWGVYLSAVLHIAAYFGAALTFYLLGMHLISEDVVDNPPLVASLADEEIVDQAAKLELTAELSTGETEQFSSKEQFAQLLTISNQATMDIMQSDALRSFSSAESSDQEGGESDSFMLKLPESGLAVTKGSFTAWTDPANPQPGQNYLIIIEVRLPDDVQGYRLSDLNGEVTGTDKYRQRIPYDKDAPMASAASTPEGLQIIRGSESVQVANNKIQLVIKVPGASRLVKDTIRIRSRRLREEQELVLVFGQAAARNAEESDPFGSN